MYIKKRANLLCKYKKKGRKVRLKITNGQSDEYENLSGCCAYLNVKNYLNIHLARLTSLSTSSNVEKHEIWPYQ